MKRVLHALAFVLCFASCNSTGVVSGIALIPAKPEQVVSISPDNAFIDESIAIISQMMHCFSLQIVQDSLLVIDAAAATDGDNTLNVFSLEPFEYLGSFLKIGRGPGEFISPHLSHSADIDGLLCLNDNQLGKSYRIDVRRSVENGSPCIVQQFSLPSTIVDWAPIDGDSQLAMNLKGRELAFEIFNGKGEIVKSFYPYSGIDCYTNIFHMSSFVASEPSGRIGVFMIDTPQYFILNTNDGDIILKASDKTARTWKRTIQASAGPTGKTYYYSGTSTQEYLFVTYLGIDNMNVQAVGGGASVHVVNWSGDLLYEIKVKENIGSVAYDRQRKHLYALDRIDDRIFRYDLSELGI